MKEWQTEKSIEKYDKAQKLLLALFKADYNFLLKSKYKLSGSDYLNTLECMMTSIVDVNFFMQILEHVWERKPHNLADFL